MTFIKVTNKQTKQGHKQTHFVPQQDRLADLSWVQFDHRDPSMLLKSDSALRICSFNVPIIAPYSAKSD